MIIRTTIFNTTFLVGASIVLIRTGMALSVFTDELAIIAFRFGTVVFELSWERVLRTRFASALIGYKIPFIWTFLINTLVLL